MHEETPEAGVLREVNLSRRRFLKAAAYTLGLAGVGSVCAQGYAGVREVDDISIERVRVPISGLKPSLEGLKIVHMSDFHLYPFTSLELIGKAVNLANALKPDIVALTGDYVTRNTRAIYELAPVLAGLNPKLGIFAVLGNHDLGKVQTGMVRNGLRKEHITVLGNLGVELGVGGAALFIAGLDDARYGRPNLARAIEKRSRSMPTVLLVHEPDYADQIPESGRISLQLSGHSHGGQIRLPGVGALYLPTMAKKYDYGLYRVNDVWVYTNRGIGVVDIPMRLNCSPEITEITLCDAG